MIPPGWKCPRRIGFLFPHQCERLTPVGCPDCDNGQIDDPYRERDRGEYSDYDDYGDTGSTALTEADGENLVRPEDQFEDDFTES